MNLPEYKDYYEIIQVALGGSLGAFIKDILNDGFIELPYKKDGKVYLGFVGGTLIGAFIGMAIDGSFTTALLGGYTGSSILKNLVAPSIKRELEQNEEVENNKSQGNL